MSEQEILFGLAIYLVFSFFSVILIFERIHFSRIRKERNADKKD